jgi:hypothetical protein
VRLREENNSFMSCIGKSIPLRQAPVNWANPWKNPRGLTGYGFEIHGTLALDTKTSRDIVSA